MPIARHDRNMELVEDEEGLLVTVSLDVEHPDVELLARKLKNGLVDQMPIGFVVNEQT
jgi:HK97 family phage prohead protease